jgi:D-2-hydroxyacid dehydrogenase (NADP+)
MPVRVIVPDFIAQSLAGGVAAAWPGAEVVAIGADGRLAGSAEGAVALFRYFPNDRFASSFKGERIDELIDALPSLRLVQSHSVGVDGLLTPRLRASNVVLCNAAPLHTGAMAETVLALMLAAAKRIPFHVRNQQREVWQRAAKLELRGTTVTIVGFGRIGSEAAKLCNAFGMRVIGVRRSVPATPPAFAERVVALEGLDEALAEADWVVLALPLDEKTSGLIDAKRLDRCKRTACLVNVARGEVIDEEALVERLGDGRLAFACLDVFRREPLPQGHPLWRMPNVLITPHNSASSQFMESRVNALFLDNLGRLARSEPLLNRVESA